jgi:hypothetical protein
MAREYENVEYRFTKEELLALGQQLAHSNQQVYDLRAERVATVASLTGSIKAAEKISADLTMKIERKSEMREVEVVAVMDKPKIGLKTIVRADNGVEVRVAVMSLEEQQGTLDLGDKPQ